MHANMNGKMVWAWELWYLDAAEHERCYGLAMDAAASTCVLTPLVAPIHWRQECDARYTQ